MPTKIQLTLEGMPKQKGGAREGAGRKKTAPKSVTIRVAEAVAFDCKRISDQYKEGSYEKPPGRIIIATPVHAGTRPWLRKYAEEKGITESEAACELLVAGLGAHYCDELW